MAKTFLALGRRGRRDKGGFRGYGTEGKTPSQLLEESRRQEQVSTYKDSVRKWWMRDQQKENLLVKDKEASGGGITETRRWRKKSCHGDTEEVWRWWSQSFFKMLFLKTTNTRSLILRCWRIVISAKNLDLWPISMSMFVPWDFYQWFRKQKWDSISSR